MFVPQTLAEYQEKHYYKKDLIGLCRHFGLPTTGTKAELSQELILFFKGMPLAKIKAVHTAAKKRPLYYDEIDLDTKLVGSGFAFNDDARKFFADYFGVETFHFSKQMTAMKRKARREHDTKLTVGDLIDVEINRGRHF